MRVRAVVAVVLSVAGCASTPSDATDPTCPPAPMLYDPEASVVLTDAGVSGGPDLMQLDPDQRWDLLAASWGWPTPNHVEFPNATTVPGFVGTQLSNGTTSGILLSEGFIPDAGISGVTFSWAFVADYAPPCHAIVPINKGLSFDAPAAGVVAQPGQGVHAWYAGFWENGTLFDTNIPFIDRAALPRAAWYDASVGTPLPVYVYDQARTERPAHWAPLTGQAPPTGTPVDDAAAAGSTIADATIGIGYYTTINGFNDALKGLSTRTTRVVHIAPEDAYTRPGNEQHVLYGDALVFLVKLEDVVDAPCPSPPAAGTQTSRCARPVA